VVRTLSQGLLDLGLLTGSLNSVLETNAYHRFYMHRTSHWLGLDVHDVGEYKVSSVWRPLRAGMVLTIEPGCYIRPADDVPEAFWNIGVRIEDNLLITADGHENLTAAAPKQIADIEALMAEAPTHG
jgi:Xaa-Pro aminopeptidase